MAHTSTRSRWGLIGGLVVLCGASLWFPASAGAATPPSITIVVDAIPNNAQDFGFTGCQGAGCADFSLDDDPDDAGLPSTMVSSGLAPGTYTVSQALTPSWTLVDISCDTGEETDLDTRTATIVLEAGEDVTCTFYDRAPAIRVIQDTAVESGQDFTYTGCQGAGCASFSLDDDADGTLPGSVTGAPTAPGTYTITQTADARWPLTSIDCTTDEEVDLGNRRVTITLEPTELAACTFINTTQSLTVVQDTQPDAAEDFGYTGCFGNDCGTFSLDDDADGTLDRTQTIVGLVPGNYSVTQDPTVGYDLTGLSCTPSEAVDQVERRATIALTVGEHVTCTFTNTPGGPPAPVTQVAAGFRHDCTVVSGGQARCWGLGTTGPVGDGTTTTRLLPVTVSNPEGTGPLTNVAAIDGDGWASTPGNPIGVTCARLTSGQARCWGAGVVRPAVILNAAGTGPLLGVSEIRVGRDYACARLNRQVRCWGANGSGQLGDGTTTTRTLPTSVVDVDGAGPLTGVAQISAGMTHACALLVSGEVRCWGANERGQLGNGSTTSSTRARVVSDPSGSGPLTGVSEISAGSGVTCARLTSGEARCWGQHVGDGTTSTRNRPVPVLTPDGSGPLTGIAAVSAGGSFGGTDPYRSACALLTDGGVRCWGSNATGQLGDGTTTTRLLPVAVSNSGGTGPLTGAAAISVGGDGACALLAGAQAWCWGSRPGNGSTSATRPVRALVQ